jgi:hypothetical protein
MTSTKRRIVDGAITLAIVATFGAGLWLAVGRSSSSTSCQQSGRTWQVTIHDDIFAPTSLAIKRCDRVTVTNTGHNAYRLMFGNSVQDIPYPGFNGKFVAPGQQLVLDARKAGDYPLHEHLHDKATLQIKISE